MEKKLKWVRIDILVVIILALIGNISTFVNIINIPTLIEEQGILNVLYSFGVPILIIGLLIYSYVKYKTDIKTASNAELVAVIIYFINAIVSFIIALMGVLSISKIFGFTPLSVTPLLLGLLPFIIPTILLVDIVRIRKLAKNAEQDIDSESKNTTKAMAVGSIIFVIIIVAVLALSYFSLADTLKLDTTNEPNDSIITDDNDKDIINNTEINDNISDSNKANENEITKDWFSFTNVFGGYTIKYPPTLYVTTDNSAENTFLERVIPPGNIVTTDVSQISISVIDREITGQEDIKIGNFNAKYSSEVTDRGYSYYSYEFSYNGKNYECRLNSYDIEDISIDEFKAIVESISFTN